MCFVTFVLNFFNSTGYYTYHQVQLSKILHADYISYRSFVWLSEETVTLALYIIKLLVFVIEMESVYCAVRPESLYKTDTCHP